MPSRLRTPFGARHENTAFCGWVSSTTKGPVHIPNSKGAMQKVWIRALYHLSLKDVQRTPRALALPLELQNQSVQCSGILQPCKGLHTTGSTLLTPGSNV